MNAPYETATHQFILSQMRRFGPPKPASLIERDPRDSIDEQVTHLSREHSPHELAHLLRDAQIERARLSQQLAAQTVHVTALEAALAR